MNTAKQTKETLKALFASQRFAVLATQDEGQPYASLMAFAATDDLRRLIFATERETRKYTNLVGNPRAAALIDDRSNQGSDTTQAIAVTALGETRESDKDQYLGIFLKKHPHLETFVKSPSCTLLAMQVSTYFVVKGLQDTRELRP
ncbi:MAG: pyridoxamine 5'-phosphate oxidase family protein [Anaerolineae bacterium]|nr:pyridoxamine 5'-phosphate oxidase family protein [Anaerolineae bacterium]